MMGLLPQAQLLPPAVSVTPKEKLFVVLVVVEGLKIGRKLAAEPSHSTAISSCGLTLPPQDRPHAGRAVPGPLRGRAPPPAQQAPSLFQAPDGPPGTSS